MTPVRRRPGEPPGTATWIVDPRRTRVAYWVCLLGLRMAEGTFHEVSGECRFDPDHPSSSATGSARIAVASIDTGDAELDRTHLGPDVFDAETYPEIVLETTSITPAGGGHFRMTGDVTIRDVTRPVDFDIDYGGVRSGRNGARRATMTMTARVDLADFRLTSSVILRRLVATRVDLTIEAELRELVA